MSSDLHIMRASLGLGMKCRMDDVIMTMRWDCGMEEDARSNHIFIASFAIFLQSHLVYSFLAVCRRRENAMAAFASRSGTCAVFYLLCVLFRLRCFAFRAPLFKSPMFVNFVVVSQS